MDVKEVKAEGLLRQYTISVAAGEIQTRKTARLEEVGKTVKIPGFRTGKVPERLLQDRYGKAVMGEILEKLVNEHITALFKEKEIKPADQPKIEVKTYDENKGLEFDISLDILPEIEHIDYSKIAVTKKVVQVSDEEVKKSLENIAANHSSSEALKTKRKAKKGDITIIDFIGRVDGQEFAGGSGTDYSLELGAGMFIAGFEEQVEGHNPGETFDVHVTFPKDYGAKELAGKDAVFEVTIKELHKKVPAKLDDELAKKLGLEDFAALKKTATEQHQKQYENLSRMHMKRELLDALDKKYTFELPSSLVDQELSSIVEQWKQQKEHGAQELGDDADKTEEEVRSEYQSIAQRRVRLGLVLTDLGQKENVQITEEDKRQALFNEVRRFPGQEQQVFEFFQKNPQALSALEAPILEERVIDVILDKAKVAEKTVTIEELMADPDEESGQEPKKEKASKKKAPAKADKDKAKEKPKAKKAPAKKASVKADKAEEKPKTKKAPAKKAPAKKASVKADKAEEKKPKVKKTTTNASPKPKKAAKTK